MSRSVYPRHCHLGNREKTEAETGFSPMIRMTTNGDWNTDFARKHASLCKLFVSQSPTRVPDPVTQCIGYA